MAEMEDRLSSILSNPQLMQQIMALAQSMNNAPPPPKQDNPAAKQEENSPSQAPNISAITKLLGLSQKNSIDKEQEALLRALNPYLSPERINKLERAMRAAKMAQLASSFLNSGGLQILSGR